MTRTCKCGGTLRRTDIVGKFDSRYGRVMYSDTDPLAAHWRCEKCGAERIQRKRQPKAKPEKS